MTVIDTIGLITNEFNDVDADVIELWIEMVRPLVSKKQFGKMYELALAYLVCHKMKMSGHGESSANGMANAANSFGISSVSDGGTSISFNSSSIGSLAMDAEYSLTSYGTQYLQLKRMLVAHVVVQPPGACL